MPPTTPPSPAEYLTADDVAALLQVPRKGVYALVHRAVRPLPAHPLGRRFRFVRAEVHAWVVGEPPATGTPMLPAPPRRAATSAPPPPASFDRPRVTRASLRSQPEE